ncbi:hypothetical protein BC826DRAFT_1027820 [Russula brevipes]|nr:hypothetical protein BC826DRAFT_1027820 [Russula brevipes]
MPSVYVSIHRIDFEYFQEDIVIEYVDCHLAFGHLIGSSHRYSAKDLRRRPPRCTECHPITSF